MMLSKDEWTKKYVSKWKGIRSCDTKNIEGGYLFLWNDGHSVAVGHSERNIRSRSQAVEYYYQLYRKAQLQQAEVPASCDCATKGEPHLYGCDSKSK